MSCCLAVFFLCKNSCLLFPDLVIFSLYNCERTPVKIHKTHHRVSLIDVAPPTSYKIVPRENVERVNITSESPENVTAVRMLYEGGSGGATGHDYVHWMPEAIPSRMSGQRTRSGEILLPTVCTETAANSTRRINRDGQW